MRAVFAAAAGVLVGVTLGMTIGNPPSAEAQQQPTPTYLLIDECEIPAGTVISAALKEASGYTASFRQTGEYKSVRLFIHSFGPRLSIYRISEPKNWQSLVTGFDKFVAANPALMTSPLQCASHSDNILSEVVVP